MKTKRKFLALVLVVLMTMALAIPAFADAATGSITVKNATVGNDYAVYKIFDLSYTTNTAGDAITGVSYTYTKSSEDALFTALSGEDSPFTLTQQGSTSVYDVALKSGKGQTDVVAFLNGLANPTPPATGPLTPTSSQSSVASDTVVFSDLPLGYYYITSSIGTVAIIDNTLPNATVYDKNQRPVWDNDPDPDDDDDENPGKVIVLSDGTKVTENSAKFGDTVNFDIGITATNYVGDKKVASYIITDTLGAGFQKPDTFAPTVKVGDDTLVSGTDYTLTVDSENSNKFTITIPWAAFGDAVTGSVQKGDSLYANLAQIHVTYSATVKDTAVIGLTGNKNKAEFKYTTFDPETPPDTPPTTPEGPEDPKETTTYVYAIGLLKVDGKDNTTPLSGAKFTVKDSSGNAVKVSGSAGSYKVSSTAESNIVESDSNGQIYIEGLAEGTYTLNETEAPTDYNLNSEDITFTVVKPDADDTSFTDKVLALKKTFANNKGTELPATGGIGTTLFITFGMIAMLCTGVFLVTNKRISKETF